MGALERKLLLTRINLLPGVSNSSIRKDTGLNGLMCGLRSQGLDSTIGAMAQMHHLCFGQTLFTRNCTLHQGEVGHG